MLKPNLEAIERLKKDLRFGIEIECITSRYIEVAPYHADYGSSECDEDCSEDCDGYHGGDAKQYYGEGLFYAEEDGSLSRTMSNILYPKLCGTPPFSLGNAGTAELITDSPFRYYQLDAYLDALKNDFERQGISIWFNSSCGAHIHFSLGKSAFKSCLSIEQVYAFRRRVFKGMKEFFNDDDKFNEWKAYYFRKYAKRMTKRNFSHLSRDRYSEFNMTVDGRIEIRSTHLMGVKNFEEMKRVYRIFFDAIIHALAYRPMVKREELLYKSVMQVGEEFYTVSREQTVFIDNNGNQEQKINIIIQ